LGRHGQHDGAGWQAAPLQFCEQLQPGAFAQVQIQQQQRRREPLQLRQCQRRIPRLAHDLVTT
jgi:hypothetical protein